MKEHVSKAFPPSSNTERAKQWRGQQDWFSESPVEVPEVFRSAEKTNENYALVHLVLPPHSHFVNTRIFYSLAILPSPPPTI